MLSNHSAPVATLILLVSMLAQSAELRPRILVANLSVATSEDNPIEITLPADGRYAPFTCTVIGAVSGSVSVSGCVMTYTPNENSTALESLGYYVTDTRGGRSRTASIAIVIDPVNDAPTATTLSVSTGENTSVPVTLTGSDVDADAITYSIGTPSNGSLTGTAPNLTYIPNTSFSGTDSFTYMVSDGKLSSAEATVNIEVSDDFADDFETSDVTYCTHADGTEMKLDIHPAETGIGRRPMVMLVHGGGFVRGSKSADDTLRPKDDFVSRGLTVVSADYRFSNETDLEGMLQDLRCAARYLRANAAFYNIDPDHFGIMGSSAGGYLANCVATGIGNDGGDYVEMHADQSSAFQALVDWYGITDITVTYDVRYGGDELAGFPAPVRLSLLGSENPDWDVLVANSPASQVNANSPPALIQNGTEDIVVPPSQAQTFYDAYVAAGADSELHLYENAVHGFGPEDSSLPFTELEEIIDTAGDWFEQYL